MFDWLKKFADTPTADVASPPVARASPSAAYNIALSGDEILLDYPKQPRVVADLTDVAEIVMETSEEEPALWWLLLGARGELVMAFPGGATGEETLVAELKALPGFDESRFSDALACDVTGEFVVWRRV